MTRPRLSELLHWLIAAPLVLAGSGSHALSTMPPPSSESLHWFTVAPTAVASPTMLLVTVTVQCIDAPPPLSDELHCEMLVTSSVDDTVVGPSQLSAVLAAPLQRV